jgi:hypothetical protein
MISHLVIVTIMFVSASSFSLKSIRAPIRGVATRMSASVDSPVASMPVKLLGAKDLLAKTDVFIFDCDGVIWKGDALIPGIYT